MEIRSSSKGGRYVQIYWYLVCRGTSAAVVQTGRLVPWSYSPFISRTVAYRAAAAETAAAAAAAVREWRLERSYSIIDAMPVPNGRVADQAAFPDRAVMSDER